MAKELNVGDIIRITGAKGDAPWTWILEGDITIGKDYALIEDGDKLGFIDNVGSFIESAWFDDSNYEFDRTNLKYALASNSIKKDIGEIVPHFEECKTPEPSLYELLYLYYNTYFSDNKSEELANRYIEQVSRKINE
jgi:hypothetical protein